MELDVAPVQPGKPRFMPSDTPNPSEELPEESLEEAAALVARLKGAAGNRPAVQREIDAWINGDPKRADAIREMHALWNVTGVPAALVAERAGGQAPAARQRSTAPPPRRLWRRTKAIAASIVLLAGLVLAGPGLWEQAFLRMTADALAGSGTRLSLTLDDDSRVELDAGAALDVTFAPEARTVILRRGRAWFDVQTNPERPFVVETPLGRVAATGTSFGVSLQAERVAVSLTEGAVNLQHSGAIVSLEPGQAAEIAVGGITAPEPFNTRQVTAWRRDQIEVYDAPLGAVLAEIDKRHPGRIVLADQTLRDEPISGVFSMLDTRAALAIIAASFDAEITVLPGLLTVIR